MGVGRFKPLAVPRRWLKGVAVRDRVAIIDYAAEMAQEIHPHCGASIWFNEVIRTAFQFPGVDRVRILFGGKCNTGPFEGDPRPCTGFVRKAFEHPEAWGPMPRVVLLRVPSEEKTVFYRLNPDRTKVDGYCGARDRSYVTRTVDMPEGSKLFLTTALRAYLERAWNRPPTRSLTQISVSVQDGLATIDFHSKKGLGIAGTTCGGVAFFGAIQRTAFQFDSIDKIRYELGGSCRRFGNYMQTLRCITVSRADHS